MHLNSKVALRYLALIGSISLLMACAPTLIGTGSSVVDVVTQDRGATGILSDTEIRARINSVWIQKSSTLFVNVGLAVQNGYVLLTGSVPTSKTREDAANLARHVKGVKDVYDELKVGEPHSFGDRAEDMWISTKIRPSLLTTSGIHSNNYSITVFNGVVYLIGIAQNPKELEHALQITKNIKGVKNVINHMKLK